jgi:hypothetical protein
MVTVVWGNTFTAAKTALLVIKDIFSYFSSLLNKVTHLIKRLVSVRQAL